MASQHDQDWVEYQLGLQGTPTGSMHNQMGLNDRPVSQPKPIATPAPKTPKPQNPKTPNI